MVIADLADALEDLGYQNVQQFVLQDDPDTCVALIANGGRSEPIFGEDGLGRAHYRVLVRVRGAAENPEEPGTRAFAIWQALHAYGPTTLNGVAYRSIVPQQPPALLKTDARRRSIYTFTVDAYTEAAT